MRVLLLDSAFGAVPIHDYLTRIGCEVWTVGNRSHDQLALAYPERWIEADYSAVSRIRSLVETRGFEAVVPGCTDVSMSTFAHLGDERYYRWSQADDRIINEKSSFRRLCQTLKLPGPRTFEVREIPSEGRFICKPADSFSGQGVSVFNAADPGATSLAISAARSKSPTGQVVIEDFVEGQLYSYSAFVESGEVDVAYIVKEGSRYDPFAVDLSYVVEDYDAQNRKVLRNAVGSIARELDLCDGLVHLQFIDNGERLALIEMTRRCPGDLYSLLIELSLGVPYAARFASYFIGRHVYSDAKVQRRFVLRHTVKQQVKASFRGLEMAHLGAAPFLVVPIARLGEPGLRTKFARTAVAFMEEESANDVERRYNHLTKT